MTYLENSLADYATPNPDSIQYRLEIDGNAIQERVPHWSQNSAISICAALSLPLDAIRRECSIHESQELLASLVVGSSLTKKKFVTTESVLADDLRISLDIPPRETGGTLEIAINLSAINSADSPIPATGVPNFALLWQRKTFCDLEGNSGRVVITVHDFSQWDHIDKNSVWLIDSSFPEDIQGWAVAELNSSIEIRYNAAWQEDMKFKLSKLLLTTSYCERVIDGILRHEGILEGLMKIDDDELGSLGLTSKRLIRRVFEARDSELEIRELWSADKDRWVNRIQGIVGSA